MLCACYRFWAEGLGSCCKFQGSWVYIWVHHKRFFESWKLKNISLVVMKEFSRGDKSCKTTWKKIYWKLFVYINVLLNFTIINVKQHLSLHRSFLMALRSVGLTKVSLIMTLKQQMRVWCCHPLVRIYPVVPMDLCRYE